MSGFRNFFANQLFGSAATNTIAADDVAKDEKRNIFPFLELPVEIREMIYEEVLTSDEPIILVKPPTKRTYAARTIDRSVPTSSSSGTPKDYIRKSPAIPINILLINKQITAEALPTLYGTNTFRFSSVSVLNPFLALAQIAPSNIRHLRHIELLSWDFLASPYMHAFELLKPATKLKKLVLHIGWFRRAKTASQLTYQLLFFFRAMERDVTETLAFAGTEEAGRRLGMSVGRGGENGDVEDYERKVKEIIRGELNRRGVLLGVERHSRIGGASPNFSP